MLVPRLESFSYRLYTIWALAHLVFVLVASARLIDQIPRGSMRFGAAALAAPTLLLVWALVDRIDRREIDPYTAADALLDKAARERRH